MPVTERLSSFIASLRARIGRRDGAVRDEEADGSGLAEPAAEPEIDTAEEFAKIQRGMRRLSLASDRSGEMLQAVASRLDEVKQAMLTLHRSPPQAALTLDESQLLHLLDQLDRFAGVPDMPPAAGPQLHEVKSALLSRARWLPVALIGAAPGGADIRIAEFIGEPDTQVRIHRILQQGYRRADGTLLRPGVVIAGSSPLVNHAVSTIPVHTPQDSST